MKRFHSIKNIECGVSLNFNGICVAILFGLKAPWVIFCLAPLASYLQAPEMFLVTGSGRPQACEQHCVCIMLKSHITQSYPKNNEVYLILYLCNLIGYKIVPPDGKGVDEEIPPSTPPCGKLIIPQSSLSNTWQNNTI